MALCSGTCLSTSDGLFMPGQVREDRRLAASKVSEQLAVSTRSAFVRPSLLYSNAKTSLKRCHEVLRLFSRSVTKDSALGQLIGQSRVMRSSPFASKREQFPPSAHALKVWSVGLQLVLARVQLVRNFRCCCPGPVSKSPSEYEEFRCDAF